LFRRRQRRDLAAALRAVARVRAELGDEAVVQAELADGHLPEQASRWKGVEELTQPAAQKPKPNAGHPPMVRRMLPRPRPLLNGPANLAQVRGEELLRAAAGPNAQYPAGGEVRADGPHLVSSGWWTGEQRRAYHFVEAPGSALLWVYYDENEKRWYQQGTVE
jgi:protein ImuB